MEPMVEVVVHEGGNGGLASLPKHKMDDGLAGGEFGNIDSEVVFASYGTLHSHHLPIA